MDETKSARTASKGGTRRRRPLECMAWAGTGVPWTTAGGNARLAIIDTPLGA